jgi:tripartite-type tricarboxylate transporter receptor subunit TctC
VRLIARRIQFNWNRPLAETVPGFEASAIFGMGVPKNTPKELITKLNKEINQVLEEPAIKAKLVELDAQFLIGTPEDFGKLIVAETDKWAKVVKAKGAQMD